MNDFVKINNDEISVSFNTVPEAKLIIKQLKLKKKEFNLLKKQVIQEQKQIRSQYTDSIRRQGSKFRGGGGVGKFIRTVQTASRDAQRRNLARELEPLEKKKFEIESVINAINQTLLQIESFLLENQ